MVGLEEYKKQFGDVKKGINVKKVLLINLSIILGIGLILNNCGDWTKCDALCRTYCQKYSECFDSITNSENDQCEHFCQDGMEEEFSGNACENAKNYISKKDCTEFKRYVSGCSYDCYLGARICTGNGYQTCVYNDLHGCSEFSPVTNCESDEVCIDGNCNYIHPTNVTLRIDDLCDDDLPIMYRYFVYRYLDENTGEVWPSSEDLYYSDVVNSIIITCFVGDIICLGAENGEGHVWGIDMAGEYGPIDPNKLHPCNFCCVYCVDNLNHVWDCTCN